MRLVTPESAGKVLSKGIFWTRQFLALHLDRIDGAMQNDPLNAVALAIPAPHLATLIRVDPDNPEHFDTEEESILWTARSHAVLGSATRSAGQLLKAKSAFEESFRLLEHVPIRQHSADAIDYVARGEVYRRFGALLLTCDEARAIDAIETSVRLYERAGYTYGIALARTLRGLYRIRIERRSGLSEFVEALGHLNPRQRRDRRTACVVLGNMTMNLVELAGTSADYELALGAIQQMQQQLKRGRLTTAKAKTRWVEALLHQRFERFDFAERRFLKARRMFRSLKDSGNFALVSLDLGALYGSHKKFRRLASFAEETRTILEDELRPSSDLREVLSRWVENPTSAIVSFARSVRRDVQSAQAQGLARVAPSRQG